MANQEHLEILKKGVKEWNKWRKLNKIVPDLRGTDLSAANLDTADLSAANISGTDFISASLIKANLKDSDLTHTDFSDADLSGADLSGADLYNCKISISTKYQKIKGCQIGVNGFWCEDTDSAALMQLMPPGNSMQGSNPDAVIESLKRARRLHGSSMTLVGIIFLLAILGIKEPIELYSTNIKLPPEKFGIFAMIISVGLLSLVVSFLLDALKGARFLNDQKSAMTVGNFPWTLSKYSSGNFLIKFQSLITRFIMSFHPIVYLIVYPYFGKEWNILNIWILIVIMIFLLGFSTWIFIISQQFQKPILFDTETERKRKSDLEKLTIALKEQTLKIEELIKLLRT